MLIRYHLFYYAVGILLFVLGCLEHSIFYLFLFAYLCWLFYRLSWKHFCIMFVLLGIAFLYPHQYQAKFPTRIEGKVIKVSEKYCYVKCNQGIIKLFYDGDINYYDEIVCDIKLLDINTNTNDYAFNELHYLRSINVIAKGQITQVISLQQHKGLYHWIEDRLSNNQSINDYQRLLLLGEKSESIQEDYQILTKLSLVHLFALSGMHVHILSAMLQKCLGLFVNEKISKFLSLFLLGIYIFSIPMSLSLYRAYFVLVLYTIFQRWFHQLDVLSFLIIVYLIINPYLIYNASFVFSYFVYFIVLLTASLKRQLLWIYLSTIPLVLQMNAQISFFSYALGIVLTPFIEYLYMLCVGSVFLPVLEYALIFMVDALQKIIIFTQSMDSFLTFAYPSFLFVVLYYILYFCIIYHQQLNHSIHHYAIALCCLMVVFRFYSEYRIYGEITMIDVGQGDCTLIRLPMNQGNILIDTGGNKDYDLATQTIIPYLKASGIHYLDYVYISHDDYDHSGALDSLIENFPVKQVIRDYEEPRQIGYITITMLEHAYSQERNDQSLVMKIDFPSFSVLMTGDISLEVEKELVERYQKLDIDILKVSHHGSRTATSPILFQMIQPNVAMIGVKKKNMYRHPSQEVIQRLNRKGIHILRTDEDGMFHIRYYGRGDYMIFQ